MEFLKDILGEDLYKQVADAVNAHNGKPENKEKQVKIAEYIIGNRIGKISRIDIVRRTDARYADSVRTHTETGFQMFCMHQ